MKRLWLLPVLVLISASAPLAQEQAIIEANSTYNSDIDTLEILAPQFSENENFQKLWDDIPYIFDSLQEQAIRHPSKETKNDFVSKVSMLDNCVSLLNRVDTSQFPPSCNQLHRLVPQDEIELSEDEGQEGNVAL